MEASHRGPDWAAESKRAAAAAVVQRCGTAIAIGAPLYNRGAVWECVRVYTDAVCWCMTPPAGFADEALLQMLDEALQNERLLLSASRKAWLLREALERVIVVATSLADATRSPPSIMDEIDDYPSSPNLSGCSRDAVTSSKLAAVGWQRDCRLEPLPPRRRARLSPPTSARVENMALSTVDVPYENGALRGMAKGMQPRPCYLLTLPTDVAALVLSQLCGRSLGALSGTCASLRQPARTQATAALRRRRPAFFRGAADTAAATAAHACRHARALAAIERLEEAVGPRPADGRHWWDEWPAMRVVEVSLTTGQRVEASSFHRGGDRSIKTLLQQYAAGLSWMVDAGWAPVQASAAMLLLANGCCAIGGSIAARSTQFAASTHALADALRERAWATTTSAPPTYASIEGAFGLAAADAVWLELLKPGVAEGHTIMTSAPLQASLHPTQMPEPGTGPVHRLASAACEMRIGGPIVCFLSEPGSEGGALRTLLQTTPIGFALPPLATVTLVAQHEPGAWHAGQGAIWRRCFCVKVSVLY